MTDFEKLGPGNNVPSDVNVVIEIPQNADPVKYEVDKDTGAILVDRFVATPMHYPCNYGFIPKTLCGDGDPADVLVPTPFPLIPGAVIRCRPVGILHMEDDGGQDSKIVAVPISKLTKEYDHVQNYTDLPAGLIAKIQHYFEHYKDLEEGKWVKIQGWGDAKAAFKEIEDAVAAVNK